MAAWHLPLVGCDERHSSLGLAAAAWAVPPEKHLYTLLIIIIITRAPLVQLPANALQRQRAGPCRGTVSLSTAL